MLLTNVTRPSDKHEDRHLRIIRNKADGDIVLNMSGVDTMMNQPVSVSVVFCDPAFGGGRSPNTYRVLPELIRAMEEDRILNF